MNSIRNLNVAPLLVLWEKCPAFFAEAVRWRLAKRTVWNAGFGQGEVPSPRQPGIVVSPYIFC